MKLELKGVGSILDELQHAQAAGALTGFEAIAFPDDFLERTLPRFPRPLEMRRPQEQLGFRVLKGGKDAVTEESL